MDISEVDNISIVEYGNVFKSNREVSLIFKVFIDKYFDQLNDRSIYSTLGFELLLTRC